MAQVHIDHVDTVQVTGDSTALLPVLQQLLVIVQDMQARLASLADQQMEGTP